MKEPDVKAIINKIGLSSDDKFIGYVVLCSRNCDFILDYSVSTEMFLFIRFTSSFELALKFISYNKAVRAIKSLKIEERAIIMMAFDLGSQIDVIDIPSCSEMVS